MTDQTKLEELSRQGKAEPTGEPQSASRNERRTTSQAIALGLQYLLSQRRGRRWGPFGGEQQVTACVLARLGELPSQYLSNSLRQQVLESVDWLSRSRTQDGGWGSPQGDDAETTAWALIALRRHGDVAPEQALSLMRRCRRLDGGFARIPETSRERQGCPEATALAVRALGTMDSAAEDFLASFLYGVISGVTQRPASGFSVCAEILDCETGIASPFLLNQAGRVAAQLGKNNDGPLQQALLLRCLLRLRNQKAWPLAASLRAMQMEDGSWQARGSSLSSEAQWHVEDTSIIATATAVSALVLAESQPGLYFGSDLPSPRRLQES